GATSRSARISFADPWRRRSIVGGKSGAERLDLGERGTRAFGASGKGFRAHLRAEARERLQALVTHSLMPRGQIAPAARMAGRAARFAADVGAEEKYHIGVRAGAERYGDERRATMDLRDDGRG